MAVKVHWFQIEPNLKEYEYKFTGLSTDEKPQDERVALNSLFLELDTGDFYFLKQAASSSTTKDAIVEENTFTSYSTYAPYQYEFSPPVTIDEDSIIVVFDGVTYNCQKMDGDDFDGWSGSVLYGGEPSGDVFDSSEYPFMIIGDEGNIWVEDKNEHTVEIYTEETVVTEAVWEKVGSGGSEPEPSGEKLFDGNVTTVEDNGVFVYEFSPMVALNYSSIIVEFDGTRYTLQDFNDSANWYAFGKDMDSPSDEYPFCLVFGDNGNQGLATYIFTESAGTYSLKIWSNSEEGEMPVPIEPLG